MRILFVAPWLVAISLLAACTVKDVEPPSLAGPSTLARAITMTANKDTLFQNGVDFVDILVTSTSPTGQSQTIPLRAEIFVSGIAVAQDFGTLSTKAPVTPTTIRYTAPNASPLPAGQVSQIVTILVTPTDSGDFRSEVARQLDLRLVPQGVILPTNPSLIASFTVTPPSPPAFATATFDASLSTNGTTCLNACTYAWNFGDGTSGTGILTTHQYRSVGVVQASLTVTDARGAQATTVRPITVAVAAPPTGVTISVSPSGDATVNQNLFFTASATPAVGRTIARYDWNFGDGASSSGSTTTHRYRTTGVFVVSLVVTDDVGAEGRPTAPTSITVSTGTPTGTLTFLPFAPRVGQPVTFNASAITPATGAVITSYRFTWGDGSPSETSTVPVQSHVYGAPGTVVATVTVTDSLGRTAISTVSVIITP